ncbi:MAG: hypothetical protein J1E83_11380 [Lachnospiraceae bacterium]|nr:hypothetical protein [Lachnospiraceae bacterium]
MEFDETIKKQLKRIRKFHPKKSAPPVRRVVLIFGMQIGFSILPVWLL